MMREASRESALDAAAHRLERATAVLESRLDGVLKRAEAEAGGLFDQDRAKLAAALDVAHGRERDLKSAGAEASQALGRAIAEVRGALGDDAPADIAQEA